MWTVIFIVKIKAVDEIKIECRFIAFFGLLHDEPVSGFLTLCFIAVFGNLKTSVRSKLTEINHDVIAGRINNPKFLRFIVGIYESLLHRNAFQAV